MKALEVKLVTVSAVTMSPDKDRSAQVIYTLLRRVRPTFTLAAFSLTGFVVGAIAAVSALVADIPFGVALCVLVGAILVEEAVVVARARS